ncbi:hypothetical protein [Mongoliimonas terrestris]|uniref:hypothetical protein n=1 Tax=Mongoliimonas terrestris TaxID=1709001 RepID=UPI0011152309|nr:hypothetical protein [Mongoliimonas terrestris]
MLGGIFAAGTIAATAAGMAGHALQAPPADPIGALIDGSARMQAAVDELMAAAAAAGHVLPVWHVSIPQHRSEALIIIGTPPKRPPLEYSGPANYEIRVRGIQPIWRVEEAPRLPGYYRCRQELRTARPGRWKYFAKSEVTFLRRMEG